MFFFLIYFSDIFIEDLMDDAKVKIVRSLFITVESMTNFWNGINMTFPLHLVLPKSSVALLEASKGSYLVWPSMPQQDPQCCH